MMWSWIKNIFYKIIETLYNVANYILLFMTLTPVWIILFFPPKYTNMSPFITCDECFTKQSNRCDEDYEKGLKGIEHLYNMNLEYNVRPHIAELEAIKGRAETEIDYIFCMEYANKRCSKECLKTQYLKEIK